jgi:hypothetical protein
MKIKLTLVAFLLVFLDATSLRAATITSPAQDEVVYAGRTITVVVKPSPGEKWRGFVLGFERLKYNFLKNSYNISIKVPNDVLGYRVDLRIIGVDNNNNEVELTRRVFVKLPPGVVLQSLSLNHDFMLVYKLPPGSDPDKATAFESRQLSVAGKYSDGMERLITSSANGTTYVSSNEKVVTVSPEGKVTAQGLGNAKITVKNSKLSAKVDVVVKTYRQPQK